jgi:Tfp pilus assembly protein FimV
MKSTLQLKDVYIAYGRDEQAEEALLDGVVSHPERIEDIAKKL